jgi:hypothetical protein
MAASFSREMGEHRDNRAELGDDNVGPAQLVCMTRGTRTIGRTAREGQTRRADVTDHLSVSGAWKWEQAARG